jgi:soluble P-type ATPase
MIFEIPNRETLDIKTIVLDMNGTITVRGKLIKGVARRLKKLEKLGYRIILFTGDLRGNANKLCKKLGINYAVCKNSDEKEREILGIGPEHCAAIGNARIDIGTFKHAKISILVIEGEGIHVETIPFCDIIVRSINDALDLFIDKNSLIATMK